jgi:mRNA interferase RelE/StbE
VWRTEYTDIAERALLKLDKPVRERIQAFFRTRIEGQEDPKKLAEALKGEFLGLWRFRVGDYRVICDIRTEVLIVLVLRVGHRKEIYR